jgi:haloalkane dehalogenase
MSITRDPHRHASTNTGDVLMSTTNSSVTDNQETLLQDTAPRPQWLDEQLYPFQSRFVAIDGNRIHYIDEGTGPTLFFLHPGIGWSFIFREMIKQLRSRFRCVALDLPGYGLSFAAPGYAHTLTDDSRLVERFIQALGLRDVTLFAQDITGSIGLGVVARRPEWFRAVIIGPGFAWPIERYRRVYTFVKLVGSPLFRFLSVNFNFFLEYYLRNVTGKSGQHFSAQEKQAYRVPMVDRAVRRYPHDLFKSGAKSHDYLADLEQRLFALKEMPALLIFGDLDRLIKLGWSTRFEHMFPRHRLIVMKDCHHFPQEYDPVGVATAIESWWDEVIESQKPLEQEHARII